MTNNEIVWLRQISRSDDFVARLPALRNGRLNAGFRLKTAMTNKNNSNFGIIKYF